MSYFQWEELVFFLKYVLDFSNGGPIIPSPPSTIISYQIIFKEGGFAGDLLRGMNTRCRWGAWDNWQRRSTIWCLWGCLKSNWIFSQTVGNWGVLGKERSVDNSVLDSDWKWSRMALPLRHKHIPSRKSFSLMDLVTLLSLPCCLLLLQLLLLWEGQIKCCLVS